MNARKRLIRKKQQQNGEVKTRKMFGHNHVYDEKLEKWVRVD